MQEADEQTDAPGRPRSPELILNAAAINLVLVSAWLAAAMIFAVDLVMAAVLALGFSALIWGSAALVLIPVGLISLVRRPRQDAIGRFLARLLDRPLEPKGQCISTMPFTPAHPAIVVPLVRWKPRVFVLSALIVGSMSPDFEYFVQPTASADHRPRPAWDSVTLRTLRIGGALGLRARDETAADPPVPWPAPAPTPGLGRTDRRSCRRRGSG